MAMIPLTVTVRIAYLDTSHQDWRCVVWTWGPGVNPCVRRYRRQEFYFGPEEDGDD
jgi:hypothetical protein